MCRCMMAAKTVSSWDATKVTGGYGSVGLSSLEAQRRRWRDGFLGQHDTREGEVTGCGQMNMGWMGRVTQRRQGPEPPSRCWPSYLVLESLDTSTSASSQTVGVDEECCPRVVAIVEKKKRKPPPDRCQQGSHSAWRTSSPSDFPQHSLRSSSAPSFPSLFISDSHPVSTVAVSTTAPPCFLLLNPGTSASRGATHELRRGHKAIDKNSSSPLVCHIWNQDRRQATPDF
ncbi:uncharacterized protein BJX67DRAFT_160045 [Aspergillus lucknowensis]|uniref:Uncharacterized protein n=1 Tax=Aspergillus lucknowensis TaxID=176173 RepID=A0ABR4M461_9EURO